ncbi:hypothetical protein [Streptomyces cinnamoneus]|nr:hypothetical protein [Streptomyces cinnamoneus]
MRTTRPRVTGHLRDALGLFSPTPFIGGPLVSVLTGFTSFPGCSNF